MDLNEQYRHWLHRRRPDLVRYERGEDVPMDAEVASLGRDKDSHRGIGKRSALRELAASGVNQAYLEEIAQLIDLDYLELDYPVTATDLAPLQSLTKLTTLKLDSPRNIADFTPLLTLPKLRRLFISNAKHLHALDWLKPLKDQLVALGVEGSMYTVQPIDSLVPLEGFALEALFLTNTRLEDQDLSPIATMPNIRLLGTGINAPRAQFFALRDAKPGLECQWFDEKAWGSFRDPRPLRAATARPR